jgi:hypothetical protein
VAASQHVSLGPRLGHDGCPFSEVETVKLGTPTFAADTNDLGDADGKEVFQELVESVVGVTSLVVLVNVLGLEVAMAMAMELT